MGYDGGENKKLPNVTFVNAPIIGISATMIRAAIAEGKTMKYFLPPKVAQYVDEMNLFKV